MNYIVKNETCQHKKENSKTKSNIIDKIKNLPENIHLKRIGELTKTQRKLLSIREYGQKESINLTTKNKYRVFDGDVSKMQETSGFENKSENDVNRMAGKNIRKSISDIDMNAVKSKFNVDRVIKPSDDRYSNICKKSESYRVKGEILSGEYKGKTVLSRIWCGNYGCEDCTRINSVPHVKRYIKEKVYSAELGLFRDDVAQGHLVVTVPDLQEIKLLMLYDYNKYFCGGSDKQTNLSGAIKKALSEILGIEKARFYIHPCGDKGKTFHPHFHILFKIDRDNSNFDILKTRKIRNKIDRSKYNESVIRGWLPQYKIKQFTDYLVRYFHKKYKKYINNIESKIKDVVVNYNYRLGYYKKAHCLRYCTRFIYIKPDMNYVLLWKYGKRMQFDYGKFEKNYTKEKCQELTKKYIKDINDIDIEEIVDEPKLDIDWDSNLARTVDYFNYRLLKDLGHGMIIVEKMKEEESDIVCENKELFAVF
ncbi:hypothetical protein GF322_05315 [Candidatus Dependentiae bacterium]|nr:hypothetical protein [Candidatus Dependentiae bacterium]